ncbi:MAG: autotransporter-associated beta strand repeat-containing protein [Pirellulales bacterium]|nr:autotransporter-associated beta strand repeat-containing protein [Pirellulales bacterium]
MSGLCFALCLGVLTRAATACAVPIIEGPVYWSTATGDWSTSDNWEGGEPTSEIDAAIVNGGTARVTQLDEACRYLYLGDSRIGTSGAVELTGGSLSASIEYVGAYGTGSFTQSGGTNVVLDSLCLGYDGASDGTYNLNGGTLVLKSLTRGSGNATFNFGGGTLQASSRLATNLPFELTATGGNANVDTSRFSVELSGVLSNAGGLTKRGSGTLTLTGDNTYSGGTTLVEGQLCIGSPTALGTGTFTIGGSGPCEIVAPTNVYVTLSDNPMAWNGDFTFGNSPSLNLGAGSVTLGADVVLTSKLNTLTVEGVISGDHALTKTGSGYLNLYGENTFAGGLTFREGELRINNGQAIGTGTFTIGGTNHRMLVNTSDDRVTLSNNNPIVFTGTNVEFKGKDFDFGSGPVTIAQGNPWLSIYGETVTIRGPIDGDGGLILSNGGHFGTLVLAGDNAYRGGTRVHHGYLDSDDRFAIYNTLLVAKPRSLPGFDAPGNITVEYRGMLAVRYGGADEWTAADVQTLRAKVSFDADAILGFDTTNALGGATFPGSITGGIGIAKLGENTLSLPAAHAFTGGTIVTAGTLELTSGDNPLSTTGAITIHGGTLDLGGNSQTTSGNVIIRGGSLRNGVLETSGNVIINGGAIHDAILRKSGGKFDARTGTVSAGLADGASPAGLSKSTKDTLILSGVNTYTNGTFVADGTLLVTRPAALPGYNTPGKVSVYGGDAGVLAIRYGGDANWSSADADALLANASFVASSTRYAYLGFDTTDAPGGATYGGPIAGKVGISKLGANSLTLSGSNTYLGGTRVSEGTLILDGDGSSSVTGWGAVVVTSGATLAGSGVMDGRLTVAGTLSPGEDTGILKVNNLVTFQSEAAFEVDVNGLAVGAQYDQLATTKQVSLAGSLTVRFGDFAPTGHDILFLINNTGTDRNSGAFQYADDARIGTFNGCDWYITYDAHNGAAPSLDGGNDVAIHSVPEPASLVLLGLGAASLIAFVRRQRKQTA